MKVYCLVITYLCCSILLLWLSTTKILSTNIIDGRMKNHFYKQFYRLNTISYVYYISFFNFVLLPTSLVQVTYQFDNSKIFQKIVSR